MAEAADAARPETPERAVPRSEARRVVFATSLGTVFEWYDFYLYATLAPFFAELFFPPGNQTAALLSAFARCSSAASATSSGASTRSWSRSW